MPKNAIKFIRDAEKQAMISIQEAEKDIQKASDEAREEARKKREAEIFRLNHEMDALEESEIEKAKKEAERIEAETLEEVSRIREMQDRNMEKALSMAINSLFKGDRTVS